MATTHSFNNDADYTDGGQWFDDFGRRICQWQWNVKSRELTVTCGSTGSKVDLSEFGDHQFTDEQLRERLPTLSIETAQRINNTTYDFQHKYITTSYVFI